MQRDMADSGKGTTFIRRYCGLSLRSLQVHYGVQAILQKRK
jgi:hypothetical protein